MNKLKSFLMRCIPNCNETTDVLWSKIHGDLTPRNYRGAKVHLMLCKSCHDYNENLQWIKKTLDKSKDSAPLSAQYKLRPEAREKLKQVSK